MAEEEFQESDIFFSENAITNHHSGSTESQTKNKANASRNSLPVKIPDSLWTHNHHHHYVETDLFHEAYGSEIVPPHVIVGRRLAGKMAFSVCSGNGRTLKGRDLSQVRNSILRMTGFLEPSD